MTSDAADRQVRRVAGPAADGSSYFVLRGPLTDDDAVAMKQATDTSS